MRPRFATVGPLTAADPEAIRTASNIAGAGPVVLNGSTVVAGKAILDNARRVLITSAGDDSGITFTITGKGGSGQPLTEVLPGADTGAAQSALDYEEVDSIESSGVSADTVEIGTSDIASSPWVQFDQDLMGSGVAIQCNVTGNVDYTVEQTLDDPNNSQNPVPMADVVWLPSTDTAVVGASTSQQSNYMFAPVWARITLNSGDGSVTGTFIQIGK